MTLKVKICQISSSWGYENSQKTKYFLICFDQERIGANFESCRRKLQNPTDIICMHLTIIGHLLCNFTFESTMLEQWSKHCDASTKNGSSFFQGIRFRNDGDKSSMSCDFLGPTSITLTPRMIRFDPSMLNKTTGSASHS